MLKGFKEFLARGNIIDLSVAVVIGTAFTGLVTKFTESVIQPLVDRIGAGGKSIVGILKISIGGGQFIDFNAVLSAAINFIMIAAVVYFLVVLPYNTLRKRGEVKQAEDTELRLLTQIRDQLAESGGGSPVITLPTPRIARPSRTGRSQQPIQCGVGARCPAAIAHDRRRLDSRADHARLTTLAVAVPNTHRGRHRPACSASDLQAESCPMIWAANGFSVAMPSRTANREPARLTTRVLPEMPARPRDRPAR